MAEKLGIDKVKEVVVLSCQVINAVANFVHKDGILSLFPILGEAKALAAEDWTQVRMELADLSEAEGLELAALVNATLQLQNPAAQATVAQVLDLAGEQADLVIQALSLWQKEVEVFKRAKAIVGA